MIAASFSHRLFDLVVVLFGVSVIVFLMIRLIPGDAVAIMLGANTEVTPERLAELRSPHRPRPPDRRTISRLGRRGPARRFRHLAVDGPTGRGRDPRSISGRPSNSPSWRSLIGAVLAVPLGCLMAQTRGARRRRRHADRRHRRPHDPSFWLGIVLILLLSQLAPGFSSLGYVPFSEDPLGNLGSA